MEVDDIDLWVNNHITSSLKKMRINSVSGLLMNNANLSTSFLPLQKCSVAAYLVWLIFLLLFLATGQVVVCLQLNYQLYGCNS